MKKASQRTPSNDYGQLLIDYRRGLRLRRELIKYFDKLSTPAVFGLRAIYQFLKYCVKRTTFNLYQQIALTLAAEVPMALL